MISVEQCVYVVLNFKQICSSMILAAPPVFSYNEEASAISVDQSSVPSLAVSEPFWLGGIGEYEEEVDSATVSPL